MRDDVAVAVKMLTGRQARAIRALRDTIAAHVDEHGTSLSKLKRDLKEAHLDALDSVLAYRPQR